MDMAASKIPVLRETCAEQLNRHKTDIELWSWQHADSVEGLNFKSAKLTWTASPTNVHP